MTGVVCVVCVVFAPPSTKSTPTVSLELPVMFMDQTVNVSSPVLCSCYLKWVFVYNLSDRVQCVRVCI